MGHNYETTTRKNKFLPTEFQPQHWEKTLDTHIKSAKRALEDWDSYLKKHTKVYFFITM